MRIQPFSLLSGTSIPVVSSVQLPYGMTTTADSFLLLDVSLPEQRACWEQLWQSWPQKDIVAHPAYAQLFAKPQDRVVCACQLSDAGGILFPLIVRPLSAEPWIDGETDTCDLVSPYGYGGPFGWGACDVEGFWKGFDQWARANRVVSLFTRLSLFKDQLIPFCGEVQCKGPCVIVSLDQQPADVLKSYNKAARENVRQAKRCGVSVEPDPECRRLAEFFNIYSVSMSRLEALPLYHFSKGFFEKLITGLSDRVMMFHAIHQERVVATELLLLSEDYLYSFLGGTLEEGFPLRANPLLRHEINLWARDHGKRKVLLGGGYPGRDGLLRYKRRFAPNGDVPFYVGTKVFNRAAYDDLINKRAVWERLRKNSWLPPSDFFPAYRG